MDWCWPVSYICVGGLGLSCQPCVGGLVLACQLHICVGEGGNPVKVFIIVGQVYTLGVAANT